MGTFILDYLAEDSSSTLHLDY